MHGAGLIRPMIRAASNRPVRPLRNIKSFVGPQQEASCFFLLGLSVLYFHV